MRWELTELRQSVFSLFDSFFTIVVIPRVTFFGLLEVLGIHFSDIVRREEVKSFIGSEESEREVSVRDSLHKV